MAAKVSRRCQRGLELALEVELVLEVEVELVLGVVLDDGVTCESSTG
jgi:hypothetical protein